MTAPTEKVRTATYARDGFSCVCCGSFDGLSWQHRESSGHGGRGPKAPTLTTADGVTACLLCNQRFEHDLQQTALTLGWKVKRNRLMPSHEIPFFNRNTREWYLPDVAGGKQRILPVNAAELLAAAGSFN